MKKKIYVNTDAGNVEAGIAAFNSSIAEDVDYQTERQDLIARLKAKGYKYDNYDKYDNSQLYRMLDKNPPLTKAEVATPKQRPTCDECGNYLTDGGYCPVCDDGEEHLKESVSMKNDFTIKYEQLPVKRQSEVNTRNGYPDWDEWEDTVDYELQLSTNDVDEGLLAQEGIWNEPGIDDDNAEEFVAAHRESLFDKYEKELKDYFKDIAVTRAQADADSGKDNFHTYSKYDHFEDEYIDKSRGLSEYFYDDDDIKSSEYTRVSSKSVEDSDGFMTDYTWYKTADGNNIFIFGDNDIYTPENTDWDWEEEDDEAAQEWFDSYTGFGDPDDFVENLDEATDVGVASTPDNSEELYSRELKGDSADTVMDYYVKNYVVPRSDGKYIVKDRYGSSQVVVQFDIDHKLGEHKFTVDGVEHITKLDKEAGKIIDAAVHDKRVKTFDVPVDEAWERDYNLDEWEEDDIELHKSIDWKARNYRDYPVPEDNIIYTATAYGLPGGTQQKSVKFIKYIRANELFPPYYGVEEIPFEGVLSGMYDGDKKGKYMIMNRFETQDVYDALSEDTHTIKLSGDNKMVEIPIEDNSEVGELGHPIQQGIGDPRRKREHNSKNIPVKESAEGSTITLRSDYFYDLVSNIKNAGWDEILDFAHEHGWVKDGQIIIPAGTVLEFANQDRYYDTYNIQVDQDREVFPFNRDMLIEYPLKEALDSNIPAPYNKYYEIGINREDIPEEDIPDAFDNYKGMNLLAIVYAKEQYEDALGDNSLDYCYLVEDDQGKRIVTTAGPRVYEVELDEIERCIGNDIVEGKNLRGSTEYVAKPSALSRDDMIEHLLDAEDEHEFIFDQCDKMISKYKIEANSDWDLDDILEMFTTNQLQELLQIVMNKVKNESNRNHVNQSKSMNEDRVALMDTHEEALNLDDPRSWPDDKELTYDEARALAKAYYTQGGDSFYETVEKYQFEDEVRMFGPRTVGQMKRDFGVFDEVAKDRMGGSF